MLKIILFLVAIPFMFASTAHAGGKSEALVRPTAKAAARAGLAQVFGRNHHLEAGIKFRVKLLAPNKFRGRTAWGLDPRLDGEAGSRGTAIIRVLKLGRVFKPVTKGVKVIIETRPAG
jgi:hypothetical protein